MAKLPESLISSIKGTFGGVSTKQTTPEKPKDMGSTHLKIAAKNFLALGSMARDLNVASQNVKELVRVMGGKPKDKEDMHMLKESELEEKLAVETEKEKPKAPTPIEKKPSFVGKTLGKIKESKVGKKVSDLKKQFSENKFVKAFQKYFQLAALIGLIFFAFKDVFVEWASGLWETIKEKFDEWVEDIKKWFDEVVQPIIDNVKTFIDDMILKVGEFFSKIGDWFVEKFSIIKDGFENAVGFMKNVWNKFMSMIDEAKTTLRNVAEKVLSVRAIRALVPNSIINFLTKSLGVKISDEEKKKETPAPPAPSAPAPKPAAAPTPAAAPAPAAVRTGAGGVLVTERGEAVTTGEPPPPPPPPPPAPKPAPAPPAAPAPVTPTPAPPAPAPAPAAPAKAEKPKEPEAKAPAAAAKPEKIPGVSAQEPLVKKISADQGKKAMLDEMDRQKITDPAIRAAIMAQAAKETGGFMFLSENLGYSAQGLSKNFGRLAGTPMEVLQAAVKGGAAAIGELIYGGSRDSPSYDYGVKNLGNTEPGDGAKYRGRGFFQLTGRTNYKRAGALDKPQSLLNLDEAAKTAVDFAMRYKGNFSDVTEFTRYVNGGTMGLAERKKYFEQFLNDPSITKPGAAPAGGSGAPAAATPTPAPTPSAGAPAGTEKKVTGSLSSFFNIGKDFVAEGLNEKFKEMVLKMGAAFFEKTGKKLTLNEGFRSTERQKELYDKDLAANGGKPSGKVARPGSSLHEKGFAVDINQKELNMLAGDMWAGENTGWLESFGLTRPIKLEKPGAENWHIQPLKTTPTPDGGQASAGKSGKPVDPATGETVKLAASEVKTQPEGKEISSVSSDVAAGQRQQQKPSTPIVVNAPVTNNKTVQNNQVAAAPPQDSSRTVMARAV